MVRTPKLRREKRDRHRAQLEKKVDAGTKRAIKEYKKTFELLEAYDERTGNGPSQES